MGLVGVRSAKAPADSAAGGQAGARGGRGVLGRARADLAVQLTLKVSIRDIQAGLKDNAVFKKVLSDLPQR